MENAIDASNVSKVHTPLIVEAANHPLSPDADAILAERGVIVVPDILANAGGVTGSYFEWTSNLTAFRWSQARFNEELLAFLNRAFRKVWECHVQRGVDLRTAAYMVGIARVSEATRLARPRVSRSVALSHHLIGANLFTRRYPGVGESKRFRTQGRHGAANGDHFGRRARQGLA